MRGLKIDITFFLKMLNGEQLASVLHYGLFNEVWHVVDALQSSQLNIFGPIIWKLARPVCGSYGGDSSIFPILTTLVVLQSLYLLVFKWFVLCHLELLLVPWVVL